MCRPKGMYLVRTSVGEKRVSIGAWWPNGFSEKGWSLAEIQEQQDVEDHPLLSEGLRNALREMGIHRCYAPNVSAFSGEVISPIDLRKWLNLGKNIVVYRDRSIGADGIRVPRGHALIASGRGCPFIVATGGDYMFVAHAGFRSLVDFSAASGEKPQRTNMGIVYSLAEAFQMLAVSIEEITMRMEFAISAGVFEYRFDGPDGPRNRELSEFVRKHWPAAVTRTNNGVCFNLEVLFEKQACQVGVTDALAENSLAEFPYLVNSRNSEKSNLLIFKHDA